MSQESQPIGISATKNVMYRADTVNPTNNLLHTEEETTQPTISTPFSELVNPFHYTIDLSIPKGKRLCQKATCGLPTTDKYSGNSKGIIKFIERIKS